MSELSQSPLEKARKAHGAVLRSMDEPGTARHIAQILGTSDTTISRTKASLEDAIVLLYQLGWKCVPAGMRCFPEDYVQALHTMAKLHMDAGPKLEWD